MQIVIEKNIPAPAITRTRTYPFREMEIGDSFFVTATPVVNIHGCARRHRPKKFICRTVTENGVRGIRVWRVE